MKLHLDKADSTTVLCDLRIGEELDKAKRQKAIAYGREYQAKQIEVYAVAAGREPMFLDRIEVK